ncbi:hypothetical protein B0T22DRAFT_535931 [Podospora appendiculata]|uniref:Uncharacterized protein n=1 Tax=Podospora appendiculata TaxID=314037 RepID=A0AAE1CCT3_9PEZI|nr:hypothetical protein B0T22DRAFT_535931 [Podospora appendiculata]
MAGSDSDSDKETRSSPGSQAEASGGATYSGQQQTNSQENDTDEEWPQPKGKEETISEMAASDDESDETGGATIPTPDLTSPSNQPMNQEKDPESEKGSGLEEIQDAAHATPSPTQPSKKPATEEVEGKGASQMDESQDTAQQEAKIPSTSASHQMAVPGYPGEASLMDHAAEDGHAAEGGLVVNAAGAGIRGQTATAKQGHMAIAGRMAKDSNHPAEDEGKR